MKTAQNSLKQLEQTVHGLTVYSGGFITGKIFASEIWGAYFLEGLFFFIGGNFIGILRYIG